MIINLTQHAPTPEQIEQGVLSLSETDHKEVAELLSFDEIPDAWELQRRAREITSIAERFADDLLRHSLTGKYPKAMIGGAPFFMEPLQKALSARGIIPVFAFSKRVSKEKVVDGKVEKVSVFQHIGFVDPNSWSVDGLKKELEANRPS